MEFYEISQGNGASYYDAAPDPFPSDLQALVLADRNPTKPIRYEVLAGSRPGDIISWAAWSDRLVGLMRELGATGLDTYPISVFRKGECVPGYQGVRIVGRGGALDDRRSEVDRDGRPPDDMIVGHRSIHMIEGAWDGSDIFSIPGLGICVFVVPRLADKLIRARLRNVDLVLNSECRFGTKDPPPTPPPPGGVWPVFAPAETLPPPPTIAPPVPGSNVDPRALLPPAVPVQATPSEINSFTADLFRELTEHIARHERRIDLKPDRQAHVRAIMQSVPRLTTSLAESLRTSPRHGPTILAICDELNDVCGDSVPTEGSAWVLLRWYRENIPHTLKEQGMADAEINDAVRDARCRREASS